MIRFVEQNNLYDSDSDHTNKKRVSMGHYICFSFQTFSALALGMMEQSKEMFDLRTTDGVAQLPQILHFRVKPRCSICMFFALHRILMICKEKNIVTL